METSVDVYRAEDFVKLSTVNIVDLLAEVFEGLLGVSLAGALFDLAFLPILDRRELVGTPSLINLRSTHGYVVVRIIRGGALVYQHPHSVREVVGRPLQRRLSAQFPEETQMGFSIVDRKFGDLVLVRPTPRNRNSIDIKPNERRASPFHLEEILEPLPPIVSARDLGISPGDPAVSPGVVLTADVYDQLMQGMPFSADVEEGGFLAGKVFRDADHDERHMVLISAVLRAERTGASLLHFTFTGDSFLLINEMLARRALGERLVGWYHTHLFPATDDLGLSTIDIELHRSTFQQRWQVAGLINLDGTGRHLRFYGSAGQGVVQLSYQVGADR